MRETSKHKYLLPEDEFEKIKTQLYINQYIEFLEKLFKLNNSELHKLSRSDIDSELEIVESFLKGSSKLINVLYSNDGLADFLQIDIIKIDNKIQFIRNLIEGLNLSRANPQKPIYNFLRFIFWEMSDLEIQTPIQIKFVLTLLYNYNFDDYGKITARNEFSYYDRIKQIRRKAMNELNA